MYAGIVGLPNVGKSTLFNAITNSKVEAANYPFATINPNVGVAVVPDYRLDALAKLIDPFVVTPAVFQFMDIAGLVKGASKGEGLGNKFLASIREVDLICHVVRCFADPDIVHVENTVDPIRDIETINLELIFADIEVVQGRLSRISKKAGSGDSSAAIEKKACQQLLHYLDQGKRPVLSVFSDAAKSAISQYNLLSLKPVVYVTNVADGDIANPESNSHYLKVVEHAKKEEAKVVAIAARLDAEMSVLSTEERTAFMSDLGISTTGLDALAKTAYEMLGLRTFFTFGKSEVRAWTFHEGMTAPECAGVIHSDFQKGFIKCETIDWAKLVECGSEVEARNRGLMRIEGKDYKMRDGDVCHFKFNVTK